MFDFGLLWVGPMDLVYPYQTQTLRAKWKLVFDGVDGVMMERLDGDVMLTFIVEPRGM